MYDRFTDRARKVMQLANSEAQRFNHEYIGTEHILLGLVKEGSGVAANVLKNLNADLREIRREVERIVPCGPDSVTMGKLPQTPRAKKVIEYAVEEARSLGHNYVGTEHLLLGLVRDVEGVASQVLLNLGLKLADVRQEVLSLLGHTLDPDGSQVEAKLEPRSPGKPDQLYEYDLYLPLHRADGTPLGEEWPAKVRDWLKTMFGGVLESPTFVEGAMKVGNVTLEKELVIYRVVTEVPPVAAGLFFSQVREVLKAELRCENVLILGRDSHML